MDRNKQDTIPSNKKNRKPLTAKVRSWMAQHKKATAIIAVIATVLLTIATAFIIFYNKPLRQAAIPTTEPKAPEQPKKKYYSALTGLELPSEADTKKPITSIMIENSPAARPQSGMQQAEVTYEAIAEAGITRFLNIYQQNKPSLIGPVRSLRPYFVEWLAPWQASVAHVGGSKRSLDEVRNGSYRDIDQFFNPATYWRSTDRYAPHNVYTNFEKIDALNAEKGYTTSEPKPLKHTSTKKPATISASTINVVMSSATYNSSWQYHAESNTYHRQQGGEPHVDREAGQISSNSVVVLKMHMDLIMEDGWRENYHVSGTGDGVVFQDGHATEVTWHKPAPAEQLFFTDKATGKSFPLTRGKVWITAIPVNKGGAVSWQ